MYRIIRSTVWVLFLKLKFEWSFLSEPFHFESCFQLHFCIPLLFVGFDFEDLDTQIEAFDFQILKCWFNFQIVQFAWIIELITFEDLGVVGYQ